MIIRLGALQPERAKAGRQGVRRVSVEFENARVEHLALLERRPHGAAPETGGATEEVAPEAGGTGPATGGGEAGGSSGGIGPG